MSFRGRPTRSSPIRSPRAFSTRLGFRHPGPYRVSRRTSRPPGAHIPQPVMMLWSPCPRCCARDDSIFRCARRGLAQLSTGLIVTTARHRGRGLEGALWHRQSAPCGSPALNPHARRRRLARQRGTDHRNAGGRNSAPRRHPDQGAPAGGHHVSTTLARKTYDWRDLHVPRSGPHSSQDVWRSRTRSTSRWDCRSFAPRRIMALRSTSPATGKANPSSLIAAFAACGPALAATQPA